jgi:hypothetical protein
MKPSQETKVCKKMLDRRYREECNAESSIDIDYLFCITHPEAESRIKRFRVIIVEADRPGFWG